MVYICNKYLVTHVAFGMKFDKKFLSFEAQFANSCPWEGVHFENALEDK